MLAVSWRSQQRAIQTAGTHQVYNFHIVHVSLLLDLGKSTPCQTRADVCNTRHSVTTSLPHYQKQVLRMMSPMKLTGNTRSGHLQDMPQEMTASLQVSTHVLIL